jgi:hypothetical protein
MLRIEADWSCSLVAVTPVVKGLRKRQARSGEEGDGARPAPTESWGVPFV